MAFLADGNELRNPAFSSSIPVLDARPKKRLEPLGDCVVFKLLEATRTEAGLHIPDRVDSKKRAQVIAIGPGRMREDGTLVPMPVKVGDQFICWPQAPGLCSTDQTGEALWCCHAGEIAALVVENGPELAG